MQGFPRHKGQAKARRGSKNSICHRMPASFRLWKAIQNLDEPDFLVWAGDITLIALWARFAFPIWEKQSESG